MSTEPLERDGISALLARREPPGTAEEAQHYAAMIAELRTFLDRVAAARLGAAEVEQLTDDLRGWSVRLAPLEVAEADRQFGLWTGSPNRGQALVPDVVVTHESTSVVEAEVRFGRFFLGENGAAHGGAVPLLFDDLVGHLAFGSGGPPSRTASLATDFRSITPVGPWLTARAWVDRSEGRKHFYRATIHHGEVLCAEAEALLIALRPGQQ